MVAEKDAWISSREFARILGICIHAVGKVATAGGVRRKVVPGVQTRFCKADVERLAASCIVTGGDPTQQGRVA